MSFDWTIFETIKEFVYISDIETYEIVYMNKSLRDALGCSAQENYCGKKCYSILQGKDEPCEFCSNAHLREDEVYNWYYANPILKKTVVLQDTLINRNGRNYRLEIASEAEKDVLAMSDCQIYTPNEIIVNECLQYALNAEDYETTFSNLISFIGSTFQCARVYIFEINKNHTFSNTYEWCAPGVTPQKELLQNEPLETIDCWMEVFRDNQLVIIEDIELIRKTYPQVYAALKPQDIQSLAACPLRYQDEIIGFLGVDNPEQKQISAIASFFRVIEYFVVSFLKRRDLSDRLEYISYHDQLTGAFNRSAYKEKEKRLEELSAVGIVYCDITGLKRVNDQLGHLAGDDLIRRCYQMLHQAFEKELIYRIGGDEFLVICPDILQLDFREKCDYLRALIGKADCNMAVGAVWGKSEDNSLQTMVNKAEEEMYDEKRAYYTNVDMISGKSSDRRSNDRRGRHTYSENMDSARNIQQFLQKNTGSIDSLIDAVTSSDSPVCLYIGDMQTNLFYISDNMQKLFGFDSNMVEDLLTKWEKRICYSEDLEIYRKDIRNLWKGVQDKHDFKYRVYDKDGNLLWIHCRGVLYRDPEKNLPQYLAGCISRQEFLIDPITNFPRENAAVNKLEAIQKSGQNAVVLGIGLNHFAEINETKGRGTADNLLREITLYWENRLSRKVWFCRLDGVRFMGIIHPEFAQSVESIIAEIRESVRNFCRKYHVMVKYPCSVCVFHYPADIEEPDVLVEKVITFIEVAKNNIERDYIAYSAQEVDLHKSQAEFILHLNEDVLNDFQNFRIVIQPIVTSVDGNVIGGEVLLRWRFMGEDISPAIFIPLLEKKGLICQVGRWVFEEAVRHCRRIVSDYPQFHLSFNVSYLQISDEGFIGFMEQTLRKYGIDGSNLIMELTENHFDDEPEKLMEFVDSCKRIGMSIALDDFGQGYSSLGLLLKYPANLVKLDRSLLMELTDSTDKQNFLKTMVFACHQFGKRVCVEGVETRDAVKIIQETGGDMIQGFFFYRPLELGDFYEILHKE